MTTGSFLLVIFGSSICHYWSFLSIFGQLWVIFCHFWVICGSFFVIENCLLTKMLHWLQWRHYHHLVVGVIISSEDFLIMDSESTDSECNRNNYHGDGSAVDEDKILSGSVQASSHRGTHAASRLSDANGLSVHRGLLIELLLLLEGPLDLVPLLLRAIISMTLFGTLVVRSWLGKLFALRMNVEAKDCATAISITWLPQLPCSLVRQTIFIPRTHMGSSPTTTRTFNPSMWETWISLSFSGNAWTCLISLTFFRTSLDWTGCHQCTGLLGG